MKHRPTVVMIMVLMFILFGLFGCKELSKLKNLVHDYTDTHRGIAVYQEGCMIMFMVDLEGGFVFFDKWNTETQDDVTWYALPDGKFWYEEAQYVPRAWCETNGIMGGLFKTLSEEITKKEFMKAIKPLARILIKNGVSPMSAMRSLAEEIQLIKIREPLEPMEPNRPGATI